MKPFWQSKTLWINLIMALAAFIPGAAEWISGHPEIMSIAFVAINIVLRLVSKDQITIA